MERRIEWTWPRRTLSVVLAALLVLGLLLVLEHPHSAGAQPRTAAVSSAVAQRSAAASVGNASAVRAPATANAVPSQIPPLILARICAALEGVLARLAGLPSFIFNLIFNIISAILGRFGCGAISGV